MGELVASSGAPCRRPAGGRDDFGQSAESLQAHCAHRALAASPQRPGPSPKSLSRSWEPVCKGNSAQKTHSTQPLSFLFLLDSSHWLPMPPAGPPTRTPTLHALLLSHQCAAGHLCLQRQSSDCGRGAGLPPEHLVPHPGPSQRGTWGPWASRARSRSRGCTPASGRGSANPSPDDSDAGTGDGRARLQRLY